VTALSTCAPGSPEHDRDLLATLIVEALTTLSPRNLRAGTTYTVTIPRDQINALRDEIDRQYPGFIAAHQADPT
jgi:hypothetical protein